MTPMSRPPPTSSTEDPSLSSTHTHLQRWPFHYHDNGVDHFAPTDAMVFHKKLLGTVKFINFVPMSHAYLAWLNIIGEFLLVKLSCYGFYQVYILLGYSNLK
jgi:hypothetical protein